MADLTDAIKMEEYKNSLKSEAEQLVLKGFPETIVQLNALLETSQYKERGCADVHQDLNIPVPDSIIWISQADRTPPKRAKVAHTDGASVYPTGSVPINKHLTELLELVKPHVRKFKEEAGLIKMWISLFIPKIEDGNNFGVEVQEDVLGAVLLIESNATAFSDEISKYFRSRGKLVSKVTKYPHVDDYRRSVRELDEKQYLNIWSILSGIRNSYCILYDVIVKNLDKIKKPRSANANESLY